MLSGQAHQCPEPVSINCTVEYEPRRNPVRIPVAITDRYIAATLNDWTVPSL